MEQLRFFGNYLIAAWGRLRRQFWLAAGLALLCLLLPVGTGLAAEAALSQGAGFSGVTLAVSAPAGDGSAALLEQYLGNMEDVAQYCRFVSMEEGAAIDALRSGEVSAVLALPADLLGGVWRGEDPDVRLIVPADKPLEALLLAWVGQSAGDLLAAAQGGVYAALDVYEQAVPAPEISREQLIRDINLRYVRLTLNRGSLFEARELSAAGALPVSLHYALSLTMFFALSAAPLAAPLYDGEWLSFQKRLRAAGRGIWAGYLGGVAAGTPLFFLLTAPALVLLGEGRDLPALLGAAAAIAAFCSVSCGLCCLLAGSAAGGASLACGAALAALLLAGGVIPPALLPEAARRWSGASPVGWLRQIAAGAMGQPVDGGAWACLAGTAAAMVLASAALYRRRAGRQEGTV